jgi:hypothetical protein
MEYERYKKRSRGSNRSLEMKGKSIEGTISGIGHRNWAAGMKTSKCALRVTTVEDLL